IAYVVHVVSQFVSDSTGPRRGIRRHSLGNSAEDHTCHRLYSHSKVSELALEIESRIPQPRIDQLTVEATTSSSPLGSEERAE
nr:hypothetical protein [Tanacetum cinerariifolium]